MVASINGNMGQRDGLRMLVVYYSRSETTHKIALIIAQELGADLERITDRTDRSGFFGYMRSGKEASTMVLAEIDPLKKDPADYDLVIIGTPVWAWTMCSPIRTYLTNYKSRIARVAFFCTADGRESNTLDDMAKLIEKSAETTMVVYRKEVKNAFFSPKINMFVSEVKKGNLINKGGDHSDN